MTSTKSDAAVKPAIDKMTKSMIPLGWGVEWMARFNVARVRMKTAMKYKDMAE